jgi:hypothetical protein
LWLRRFLVRFPPNAVEELNWFSVVGNVGDEDGCIGAGAGAICCPGPGIGAAVCCPGGSTCSTGAGGCPGLRGVTFSGTGGADENRLVRDFAIFLCQGRESSSGLLDGVELNQSAIPPPDFLRKLRCLLDFDLDLFFMCLVRMCDCLLYKIQNIINEMK